ncbi:MAG: hypothetical protein QOF36_1625, partial [Microbacteriaceae bacterium]|nr:hypothetical protein [Microbacteriaceae bacterium]
MTLTNPQLLESTVLIEEISRELDVLKVRFAAEIASRSRSVLGNAGLAASEGHLNPESLLRSLTRSSFQEAARRIRVGTVLAGADASAGVGAGTEEDAGVATGADPATTGFVGSGPFAAIA